MNLERTRRPREASTEKQRSCSTTQKDLRRQQTFREQNCVQKCPLGSKISSQNKIIETFVKGTRRVDRLKAVESGVEDECHVINLSWCAGWVMRSVQYSIVDITLIGTGRSPVSVFNTLFP